MPRRNTSYYVKHPPAILQIPGFQPTQYWWLRVIMAKDRGNEQNKTMVFKDEMEGNPSYHIEISENIKNHESDSEVSRCGTYEGKPGVQKMRSSFPIICLVKTLWYAICDQKLAQIFHMFCSYMYSMRSSVDQSHGTQGAIINYKPTGPPFDFQLGRGEGWG